jgi:NAD(P)-dependent dehydrogenase (short-subunit alcohol dehydrogenase family)
VALDHQVVLITGGSRGIGKAVSLRLARERPGHIVVGYSMDYTSARQTVAEIEATGVPASMVALDVGKEELLRKLFDHIGEKFSRLDIFISNAARTSFRPVMELNSRSWQRIMDMNARAFLLGSQMAAELMGAGGGRIIGISSLGSRFYVPDYAGLGAAKAVMETLARYLAVELAPQGINVNVVCAGFVDTPIMRLAPDYNAMVEHLVSQTPAGRLGTPEDVAGIVAFLCSGESDWIRGQTLVADGGYSLVLSHRHPGLEMKKPAGLSVRPARDGER